MKRVQLTAAITLLTLMLASCSASATVTSPEGVTATNPLSGEETLPSEAPDLVEADCGGLNNESIATSAISDYPPDWVQRFPIPTTPPDLICAQTSLTGDGSNVWWAQYFDVEKGNSAALAWAEDLEAAGFAPDPVQGQIADPEDPNWAVQYAESTSPTYFARAGGGTGSLRYRSAAVTLSVQIALS
ncbi:hypothetical protein MT349_14805 [Rathayibacter caricis]|uniref:hypothetical protein n=1 Tax=Rathayibacter caricis TaxID=110936 RepID=UPI001FB1B547|nr:hypothetical protein [Rathayibacter caricis]MCJ1697050.1 hypothetical protein [Rathayibacter caricis]